MKTEVGTATGPHLSTIKQFKYLKKNSLWVYSKYKNQNFNELIIKGKNGGKYAHWIDHLYSSLLFDCIQKLCTTLLLDITQLI